jgi:hypothetical protein
MKHLKSFTMLLLLLAAVFTFSACGGDDGGGSSDSGGGSSTAQINNDLIMGDWSGLDKYETNNIILSLKFYYDNSADMKILNLNPGQKDSYSETFPKFRYYTDRQEIHLIDKDNMYLGVDVLSLSGSSMRVKFLHSTFYLTRSGGDSGGGSSGGGVSSGKQCTYCQGNGKCNFYTSYTGNKYYCHGSGKCQFCGGDGYTDGFGINNVLCTNCYGYKGSGKCSYCSGTGICSKCGGTGYR